MAASNCSSSDALMNTSGWLPRMAPCTCMCVCMVAGWDPSRGEAVNDEEPERNAKASPTLGEHVVAARSIGTSAGESNEHTSAGPNLSPLPTRESARDRCALEEEPLPPLATTPSELLPSMIAAGCGDEGAVRAVAVVRLDRLERPPLPLPLPRVTPPASDSSSGGISPVLDRRRAAAGSPNCCCCCRA